MFHFCHLEESLFEPLQRKFLSFGERGRGVAILSDPVTRKSLLPVLVEWAEHFTRGGD